MTSSSSDTQLAAYCHIHAIFTAEQVDQLSQQELPLVTQNKWG